MAHETDHTWIKTSHTTRSCVRCAELPLAFLKTLPVLHHGHADDLLYDDGSTRLWRSREVRSWADGETCCVTVERFLPAEGWLTFAAYWAT